MTTLEDDLRAALRAEAQALRVPGRPALERDIVEPRHRGPRWLIAAACVVLIATGLVAFAKRRDAIPDPPRPGHRWPRLRSAGRARHHGAQCDRHLGRA